MPTELEDLVGFLNHGNTQIRQISVENLVPYSKTQPAIFKAQQLAPVRDLKLLVKDYTPIARNALTMLINICSDPEVLKALAEDDAFLETLLLRVTNAQEPNGNELAMLLANLAKSPSLERLITLNRSTIPALSPSPLAITQLLDLFNAGPTGTYNKHATYDYLAYLFADLAKYSPFQTYLTVPTPNSPLDPLTAFLPLTTHPSFPRRLGTATLLRNLALAYPDPLYLLQPAHSILAPLLLPLCNSDQSGITETEMESLPEECQFLTPDEHTAEADSGILKLELETLYLVTARGGVEAKKVAKEQGTYPVIRELHLRIEDEEVRLWCERLVDVIMVGDEDEAEAHRGGFPGSGGTAGGKNIRGSGLPGATASSGWVGEARKEEEGVVREAAQEEEDEDEDNAIVPIF